VSSLQALQFQYIILILYILDDYNTRKEDKLAGISPEDDIRNSSQATFILSANRKTLSREDKKKMV
jgi:hypothetical protein